MWHHHFDWVCDLAYIPLSQHQGMDSLRSDWVDDLVYILLVQHLGEEGKLTSVEKWEGVIEHLTVS